MLNSIQKAISSSCKLYYSILNKIYKVSYSSKFQPSNVQHILFIYKHIIGRYIVRLKFYTNNKDAAHEKLCHADKK